SWWNFRGGGLARSRVQDVFCDGLQLQIRRAFIYLADLRVAVQLLDRVVLHISVPAVQIDAERCDTLRDFRREDLAHRGLCKEWVAAVAKPRGLVHHQSCRVDIRAGSSKLMLHGLKVRNRFSELFALARVSDGVIERALSEPDHLCADRDPSFVQCLD